MKRHHLLLITTAILSVSCSDNGKIPGADPSKPFKEPSTEPLNPAMAPRESKIRPGARQVAQRRLTEEQMARLQRFRADRQQDVPALSAEEVSARLARFHSVNADDLERLTIIKELAGSIDEAARKLLLETAHQGDPMHRVAALEALALNPRREYLELSAEALDSENPDVRAAGLKLLAQFNTPESVRLWQKAIMDPAPEVAELVFESLGKMDQRILIPTVAAGIQSNDLATREQSLLLLGATPSKGAVEALIPVLDDPISGDLARMGLSTLTGEFFENSRDAAAWWAITKNQLDDELQEKALTTPSADFEH